MFCRLSWYVFRRPNIRVLYQHMMLFCLRLTKLWCSISLNLPVCLCNCVQIYILNYKRAYHKNRQKLLPSACIIQADIRILAINSMEIPRSLKQSQIKVSQMYLYLLTKYAIFILTTYKPNLNLCVKKTLLILGYRSDLNYQILT